MPRVRVIKVPAEPVVDAETKPNSEEESGQKAEPVSEEPTKSTDSESAYQAQTDVVQSGIVISKKTLLIVVGVLVVVSFILALINRQNIDESNNHQGDTSQSQGQSEAKQYENEVRKVVDIPDGSPSVYRKVDDAEKLVKSTPTIFKNAQNGDILMMYLNQDKTGKVVLYRPSTKKIIVFIDGVDLGGQGSQANITQPTQKRN